MPVNQELKRPNDLIRGLEKTPQFLEGLSTGSRERALGAAAHFFARRMEQQPAQTAGERLNAHAVNLIATLPDFARGSWQLEQLNDKKAGRKQKLPFIRDKIPFNHALRDMIDEAPGLSQSQVIDFCSLASQDMLDHNSPADPPIEFVEQKVRTTLVGMQHEIGLEQILWNIPEIEDVIKATPEQELQGIDMIAVYDGAHIPLDAKASPSLAGRSLENYEQYAHKHSDGTSAVSDNGYPLWTGITHGEFHGGFRIDQDTVDRCTPAVAATLRRLTVGEPPDVRYA
ncbi:MAG TPA: hypothetical protein VF597_04285 [Candidatus Saccharimonadales bacterium]|jgi:hypothetical protein